MKQVRDRQRRRRNQLSQERLKQLPVKQFVKGALRSYIFITQQNVENPSIVLNLLFVS